MPSPGFAEVIDTWYYGGDWVNQWLSLRHVCGILAQPGANRSAAVLYGVDRGSRRGRRHCRSSPPTPSASASWSTSCDACSVPAEFADAVRKGAATRDATIVRFVQDEIVRLTGEDVSDQQ